MDNREDLNIFSNMALKKNTPFKFKIPEGGITLRNVIPGLFYEDHLLHILKFAGPDDIVIDSAAVP